MSPSLDPEYLFIAGAARSGTTMLIRLLDGHPNIMVLPMEASVSQRYIPRRDRSLDENVAYFGGAFIDDRGQGQQSVLASEELFGAYNRRISNEFGVELEVEVDHSRFRSGYLEAMSQDYPMPERILRGLMNGYVCGAGIPESVVAKTSYFVNKEPFYTEAFAVQMAERLPNSRFLQVVRDPYSRYASSKTRRIHYGGGSCTHVNRRCLPWGMAELSVVSLHKALENQELLGPERYHVVRFSDLVKNVRGTMDEVAEWLGVSRSETLYEPTLQGRPLTSMSSFSNAAQLDPTATKRRRQFESMTSKAERQLYEYLIGLSRYREMFDVEPRSLRGYWLRWPLRFKNERLRDYVWRLATLEGLPVGSDDDLISKLTDRLPKLALEQGYVDKM